MSIQSLNDVLARAQQRGAIARTRTGGVSDDEWEHGGEPECSACDDRGWLVYDVKVDHPDFGKVYPCRCQSVGDLAEQRKRSLQEYSNLGPMLDYRLDTVDPERYISNPANRKSFMDALAAARAYAENPVGWLTFVGPSSCGKTYLAAAIANRQIELGNAALFVTANNLLDFLRSGIRAASEEFNDFHRQASEAALLVLDDLPVHQSSEWGHERLMMILSDRHVYRRPTVITLRGEPNRADDLLRTRIETLDGFGRVFRLGRRGLGATGMAGDIPLGMRGRMTLDAYHPMGNQDLAGTTAYAHKAVIDWAEQEIITNWLFLNGPTGVGKTHLAVGAALLRESMGDQVFFATFADMLDYLRSSFAPDSTVGTDEILTQIRTTDLLVLDDLGAEHSTPWAEEKLFQIVNFRYEERLPTIITTSTRVRELRNHRSRIASRLMDRRVVGHIPIEATDYRAGDEG